jgi:hypothetical protein
MKKFIRVSFFAVVILGFGIDAWAGRSPASLAKALIKAKSQGSKNAFQNLIHPNCSEKYKKEVGKTLRQKEKWTDYKVEISKVNRKQMNLYYDFEVWPTNILVTSGKVNGKEATSIDMIAKKNGNWYVVCDKL